jgi:3-oxoacyl-[acyl-carrier protein] reductase
MSGSVKNKEKVIIVSGGSKGLGQAIVECLLNDKYTVATFSRNKTDFITTMENFFPENFYWKEVEGKDIQQLMSFAQKIFQRYNRIDGLINNMGKAVDGVLTLMNGDDINELFSLNLQGPVQLTQACAKYMLLKKAGSIINISSILGIRGYSGLSVYSATKGGLDAFTRALARELGEKNIRVNAIAPGYLETDMSDSLQDKQREKIVRRTPLGRLGKVEDVIGMVRFLLSIESEFITGQTLVIDGGITC